MFRELLTGGSIIFVGLTAFKVVFNYDNHFHVVCDLDNTLIHTRIYSHNLNMINIRKRDKIIVLPSGTAYNLWNRPFADAFLWFLSRIIILHLFTTANREYTDKILQVNNWDRYFTTVTTWDDLSEDSQSQDCKDLKWITQSSNSVLIDDRWNNHVPGQDFYHIPQYKCYSRGDYYLLVAIVHILWLSVYKPRQRRREE